MRARCDRTDGKLDRKELITMLNDLHTDNKAIDRLMNELQLGTDPHECTEQLRGSTNMKTEQLMFNDIDQSEWVRRYGSFVKATEQVSGPRAFRKLLESKDGEVICGFKIAETKNRAIDLDQLKKIYECIVDQFAVAPWEVVAIAVELLSSWAWLVLSSLVWLVWLVLSLVLLVWLLLLSCVTVAADSPIN